MRLDATFTETTLSLEANVGEIRTAQTIKPIPATADMTEPVGVDQYGRLFTRATNGDGKDGKDGMDGKDGADGADGKSAYAYAQDGGFTGSEYDFARKLAEEAPKAFYVTVEPTNEEYSSDRTVEEMDQAMEMGRPLYCMVMRSDGEPDFILPLTTYIAGEGYLFSGIADATCQEIATVTIAYETVLLEKTAIRGDIDAASGNEVVTFNLIELGLPTIPADGTFVSLDMDTAEMRQALAKKVVKFVIAFSYGGLVLNGASFVVTPSGEQPAYQHTATLNMGNLLGFVTVLVSDTGVTAYARDINGYMDLYMEEALGGDY